MGFMGIDNRCEIDEHFEGTKCKVDKRILILWMLPVAVFLLAVIILYALITVYSPETSLFGLGQAESFGAVVLLCLAVGLLALGWFTLTYNALSYTISKTEVIVAEGVINKRRNVLPFVLIQDIYIQKPLLYRLLSLSILEFETASSAHGVAEGYLPGIANAEAMVRDLLEQIRKVRKFPDAVKGDRDVLVGILEELKNLRRTENIPAKTAPMTSNLEKEIARILEKTEEGEEE